MDAWVKFPVDVLITMKYLTGAFKLCHLMVNGMMPLCLGGTFKVNFTTGVMLLLTVSCISKKNKPSLCMNNCLLKFQLYDKKYLYIYAKYNICVW